MQMGMYANITTPTCACMCTWEEGGGLRGRCIHLKSLKPRVCIVRAGIRPSLLPRLCNGRLSDGSLSRLSTRLRHRLRHRLRKPGSRLDGHQLGRERQQEQPSSMGAHVLLLLGRPR